MNEVELIRSLRWVLRCQDKEILENVRKLKERVSELEEELREYEALLRSLACEIETGNRLEEQ